jgi:hypothetical protein
LKQRARLRCGQAEKSGQECDGGVKNYCGFKMLRSGWKISFVKKAPKRFQNHFQKCAANNNDDKNENRGCDETSRAL